MKCKVCVVIKSASKQDAAAIINAIKHKEISHVQLAEVLTNNGHQITEASIRRHGKHQD